MSRFSKLIDQLEDLDQQDLRNTAKVFAITAELYERLQQVVEAQKEPPPAQIPGPRTSGFPDPQFYTPQIFDSIFPELSLAHSVVKI